MRVVIALIAVGIMILAFGFYYTIGDDILNDFFSDYVYDTDDPYYLGSQLIWDAFPYTVILLSLLLLYYVGRQYGVGGKG